MTTPRATWKGYLKLALVSCPIRLYKATSRAARISSHFLHRDTLNRIQMIPHDPSLGKVARSDLISGYEYDQGRYVVLSDADLAEIKSPSDKTLVIENFVDVDDVDPLYFDQSYFLAADGIAAIETVDVLKIAMGTRRKAALARIVLGRRERMAVVRVRGRGLLLTTLHGADQVQDPDEFFEGLPTGEPSTELLNLAEQLIAFRSGRFDPHVFKDRYQAALRDLIEQKILCGETVDQAPRPTPTPAVSHAETRVETPAANVVDAFRQSIEAYRKPPAKSRSRTVGKPKKGSANDGRVSERSGG